MERPLYYDFRDVLRAPMRAFSIRKISVMTLFVCLALVSYDVFTYIALAIEGENPGYVWSVYGLFPFLVISFDSTVAAVIFGLGIVLAQLMLMMGFFAVSAINIEEVRGHYFLTFPDAVRFAFRRLPQMFYAELAIALLVGFVILMFFLLGLVTRIPFAGEWLYALFFVFPGFFVALLTVFVILVWQVSLILLPAVAAAERQGESFAAILETFSTIIRQPLRWLGYTAYSLVAAKLCGFVYAYFCFRAVEFMTYAAGLGGGRERVTDLVRSGLSHLPANSDFVRATFNIFPGIDWSFSVYRWTRGGGDEAVGYLMAFMLFLVFASVIGYMLATVATAQARGYVVIRYIKDTYRISEEASLFFTDEPVNPPIGEEGVSGSAKQPK
ncbi:MAG: hypothetical protein KAW91_06515 [candidate division Zixibacteria bacterium]|nr:hypothetical protein [candidate division Zixibacteria bacterium]